MAYKYTAYYYLKNGKTESKEIVTGYDLRTASDDQKWHVLVQLPARDILEYDIYDSKGVLVMAERWDDKKEKWVSLIKKKKDSNWHPFGL